MGPPLQFISAHTKGKLDDLKVRRTVRQNAMRAFRRSQRLQMVKEFQEKKARVQDASQELFTSFQTTTEAVANTSPTTPKIQNTNLENYHNNTEDGLSLEIGPRFAFDPFSSTWLCSHHSAPELFSHCKHHQPSSIERPLTRGFSYSPCRSIDTTFRVAFIP